MQTGQFLGIACEKWRESAQFRLNSEHGEGTQTGCFSEVELKYIYTKYYSSHCLVCDLPLLFSTEEFSVLLSMGFFFWCCGKVNDVTTYSSGRRAEVASWRSVTAMTN